MRPMGNPYIPHLNSLNPDPLRKQYRAQEHCEDDGQDELRPDWVANPGTTEPRVGYRVS